MGPQPYHGGYSGLQGILQNDMTIAHLSLHFDANNNEVIFLKNGETGDNGILQNDMTIAHLSLHFDANNNEVIFLKNGETGDNVSDGNLGLSSEFSGGNSATSDVVLLYNVTKQWHTDLCP
ncbi:hypothetical protein Q3G72_011762 [Acer saccharum]|nr:hypothetical protein Q3G72_011762 [Acer saccharum]